MIRQAAKVTNRKEEEIRAEREKKEMRQRERYAKSGKKSRK